jgi:glutamate-1-semialdehyde aminotransferase
MATWENKDTCTQAWAAANPGSRAHAQRASRVLAGGVTHDVRRAAPFPLAVAGAAGAHKWDLDGHEIICYVMGHGALLLGHSHPEVVAAVRHQATIAFHPGASHELETEWAQAVVDLVPSAGESSTFHLLIGHAGEPEEAGLAALKSAGMSPELSAELHAGMLAEGVQLFHGSGFLSAAHTETDVERTVAAFAATLARLPAGLLP